MALKMRATVIGSVALINTHSYLFRAYTWSLATFCRSKRCDADERRVSIAWKRGDAKKIAWITEGALSWSAERDPELSASEGIGVSILVK